MCAHIIYINDIIYVYVYIYLLISPILAEEDRREIAITSPVFLNIHWDF